MPSEENVLVDEEFKRAKHELEEAERRYKQLKRTLYVQGDGITDDLHMLFGAIGEKFDPDNDWHEQMVTASEKARKTRDNLTATYYPRNGRC